jgi:hypothetical protein
MHLARRRIVAFILQKLSSLHMEQINELNYLNYMQQNVHLNIKLDI